MWSKFKALPVVPKVLIIVLVLGTLYIVGKGSQHRPYSGSMPYASDVDGDFRQASSESRSGGSANQQALAQFQAEQAQLQGQVAQCEQQMTAATNQQAAAAMNGQFYNRRPACEAQMPAYIARESYLETEIYRLQTGDTHSSMTDITGVQVGRRGDTPSYRGGSSDGTGAVEDWDRGAIRGNSMYQDEDGQQHELATQDYYYRDRSSGQIIGSNQSEPPNDGRDYERFQPAGQPQ